MCCKFKALLLFELPFEEGAVRVVLGQRKRAVINDRKTKPRSPDAACVYRTAAPKMMVQTLSRHLEISVGIMDMF